jgi:hypothetical protein
MSCVPPVLRKTSVCNVPPVRLPPICTAELDAAIQNALAAV